MKLTLDQNKALTELMNLGYGRAADALSELTGDRISLEVLQVSNEDFGVIAPMLDETLGPSIASVNQMFSGPISGNALLLMDEKSALVLSRLLNDEYGNSRNFDTCARETITEVGNVLLNACLGIFENLLEIPIRFSVPRLQLEKADRILESLYEQPNDKPRDGLSIHTGFHARRTGNVAGYLVIVMGVTSLDRLMQELSDGENGQLQ